MSAGKDAPTISRRGILRSGFIFGLTQAVVWNTRSSAVRAAELPERQLRLYAPHSDELFAGAYWADGAYVRDALSKVSWLMRDSALA
jgi:uncharacterized protein YcbK (DUF882 family)